MTMRTSIWPLHKAIYARLQQDEAVLERVSGVYDFVDKNTAFPYIVVGDPTILPFETKTSYGEDITLVVHCFSQYNGKKEAYEILNLVLQSLSSKKLELGFGFRVIDFKLDQIQVFEDIDNTTKHGVVTLHYWINNE